jgi:hypothetical protein
MSIVRNRIAARLGAPLVVLLLGAAQGAAALTFPAVEVLDPSTAPAALVSDGTTLTIDASAPTTLLDATTPLDPIGATFSMAVDATGASAVGGGFWQFGPGTFSVADGVQTYLEGTLDAFFLSTGGDFSASLTYTGGSIAGGIGSGEFSGTFFVTGPTDLSGAFTMDGLVAKLGEVAPVPVPPALLLLGPALLALLRFRR